MSIYCGTDIIEIDRIKKSIEDLPGFRERIFTTEEITYCEERKKARFESYAARFAAKEAILKALGTGMTTGIDWKQIEIRSDEMGKPHALLSGKALERYEELGAIDMDISISHCREYAIAFAVIGGKKGLI